MYTLSLKGSSAESMSAALASAVASAGNISDAAKIVVTPVAFIEDDGSFTVQVVVDVYEEADLSDEESDARKAKIAAYEDKDDPLKQDFEAAEEPPKDKVAEIIAHIAIEHMSEGNQSDNDFVKYDDLDENNSKQEDELIVSKANIGVMSTEPAPEMEDVFEASNDKHKNDDELKKERPEEKIVKKPNQEKLEPQVL